MTQRALPELLQKLVSIPSINPALAGDLKLSGEQQMANFLSDFLNGLGFIVETHEVIKGRPNVVGRFGPRQPRKSIILESHLDTQGIHGMTVDPFAGETRDGRLYGRGACDTKGPMAAAMVALQRDILRDLAAAGIQTIYVGAIGEETGNIGAEQLVDLGVGADEIIVLEPTELGIVHAHKGALWFKVEVTGRAVHGSNPEEGINAIEAMTQVMDVIKKQVGVRQSRGAHALLGKPTVNFGVIQGGSSINIVPDKCVVEVDLRTLPGEDHGKIIADLEKEIGQLTNNGVMLGGKVALIKNGIPFETTAQSRLVRRLCESCRAEGISPKTEGAAWYSDAGPFSRTCREVAVFGPGSIKQAHTADEYIELASLEKGGAILQRFLRELAREGIS